MTNEEMIKAWGDELRAVSEHIYSKLSNEIQQLDTKLSTQNEEMMRTWGDELRAVSEHIYSTLSTEIQQLDTKLGTRMDRLEARMDQLEAKMDRLEARMDKLEIRMDKLEKRIDQLDSKLSAKIDGTKEQLHDIRIKLIELSEEQYDHEDRIKILEAASN